MKIKSLIYGSYSILILLITLVGSISIIYSFIILKSLEVDYFVTELLLIFELMIILLAFIIGSFTSNLISKPIVKINEAILKLSQGNFNVKVKSYVGYPDEINNLVRTFNLMTIQLKKSHMSLALINMNLKKTVNQKTKELTDKLTDLERLNKLTFGRELKMIELKKKILNLEANRIKPSIDK